MEKWKAIPDFPLYEASNMGNIRSYQKRNGRPCPHVLKPTPNGKGRLRVFLARDGIIHTLQLHRLILETFVGPCPEGQEACHNNDNCQDNRIENLRWDTPEANRADQRRNNKYCRGEDRPEAKLTEAQVVEIRTRFANGEKAQKLADEYGICRDGIYHIKAGYVWKHVGGPINYVGHNKGENGGRSKLKEHEVLQIRELHKQGLSSSAIASRFDTNRRNVSFIVNRKTWAHI
jgi:hypothetical protein